MLGGGPSIKSVLFFKDCLQDFEEDRRCEGHLKDETAGPLHSSDFFIEMSSPIAEEGELVMS
jgi:hypothetical protein